MQRSANTLTAPRSAHLLRAHRRHPGDVGWDGLQKAPGGTKKRSLEHSPRWRARRITPLQPTRTTKCFVTGSMIFQVPLKSASTTKASPGPTSTGVPPSGVMMMRPAIMCTNS